MADLTFGRHHFWGLSVLTAVGALLASIVIASPRAVASDHLLGTPDATRARYILSIAKFTEWPPRAFARPDSTLRVCFLGREAYLSATESLTGKTARKRPISVLWVAETEEARRCHILHLGPGRGRGQAMMLKALARSPVLTICEVPHAADRCGIVGIMPNHEGPQLRIDLQAARRSGLHLSSDLLQLGTVIGARPARERAD